MKKLILLFFKNNKNKPKQLIGDVVKSDEYITIPLDYTEDCTPTGFKTVGNLQDFNTTGEKALLNTITAYG